jgi:hypothetical protein
VISVMDNFSRAMLAREIYQAQDLASVLIVLSLIQCYARATEIAVQLGSSSLKGTAGDQQGHPGRDKSGPYTTLALQERVFTPGMKSLQLSYA